MMQFLKKKWQIYAIPVTIKIIIHFLLDYYFIIITLPTQEFFFIFRQLSCT